MADTGCDTCDAIDDGKLDSVRESDFYPRALKVLCAILAASGGGSGTDALSEVATDSDSMLGSALDDVYAVLYDNTTPFDILNAKVVNNTNLPIAISLNGTDDYEFLSAGDSLNIDFGANRLKLTDSIYVKYDGDATVDAALIAAETESITVSILYPAP